MSAPCPACGPEFIGWLQADPARQSAWLALPRRQLDPGQPLQAAGQVLDTVWFVEQGLLRSHFQDTLGRERNCAFHPETQWAGMPPSGGVPSTATVAIEALEPSRVVALRHADLAAWLQRHPGLQAMLMDTLAVNLLAMSRREGSLLMDSAEQRYLRFLGDQPAIAKRLALHQVASYLGITNVALSRIRRRIRDRPPLSAP